MATFGSSQVFPEEMERVVLPPDEEWFFDRGSWWQTLTSSTIIDRRAEDIFDWITQHGLANWGKFFGDKNSVGRIEGAPVKHDLEVGDELMEVAGRHNRLIHYTVTAVVPGRMFAIEGRAVYKGVVNPKVMAIAQWSCFPEPDGSTRIVRYFAVEHVQKPKVMYWVTDPKGMEEMLDNMKKVLEDALPKN